MKFISEKMSHCIVFKGDSSSGTNKTSAVAVNPKQDKLFDPSIDMMVNDFDDEQTLEEEEALAAVEAEDPHAELSSLQRLEAKHTDVLSQNCVQEGDMPLEELLALYGYGNAHDSEVDNTEMGSEQPRDHPEEQDADPDVDPDPDVDADEEPDVDPDPDPDPAEEDTKMQLEPSKLQQLYDPIPDPDPDPDGQDGSRLLRSVSRVHSEEEDDDYDYSPDEDEWKKTIMVGQDYQAGIPEGLCSYDDALPYENEDKLLWDPHPLQEHLTEDFLCRAAITGPGVAGLPMGCHLRDDEQALFLLLQCGHNVDEALRRRRITSIPTADAMSLWSEEECRNFENGLRSYGKDFHMIQQNKVRTRSVGELVQFYYLWKKTERHDVFANKARLEKKKYTLHPGLTDFMDRFLEEQDGGRDRSSSPNMCVSAGDAKKPSLTTVLANNGTAAAPTVTAIPVTTPSPNAAATITPYTTPNSEQSDVRM